MRLLFLRYNRTFGAISPIPALCPVPFGLFPLG